MHVTERIIALAEEMQPQMVVQRRDFHKHAETGWFEMRTSSIIARKLTDLGYEVLTGEDVCDRDSRMGVADDAMLQAQYERAVAQGADPEFVARTKGGMTGVIGILHCGEGPTLAMRFDIDALGVMEAEDMEHRPAAEGFASINKGFMHACGHDAHATIGLGVARVLMDIKDHLHGTVKLIFQPAEEGVRGAKSIVQKGHLDGVDFFLGNHITARPAGSDALVAAGTFGSLATCKYDVVYRGLAAHAGGKPQAGKNALLAAACAALNLHAIPRHSDGGTRINVGTLHAGSGRNVIPDEAKMEIELRGETTALNDYMCQSARRVLESAAQMYDCSCEIRLMGAADSLHSDIALAERVARVSKDVLGMPVLEPLLMKNGGSEDIAYMMNRVQEQGGQATFFRVLTTCAAGAHNRRYDFDETVMQNGVKVFCATAYDIMK